VLEFLLGLLAIGAIALLAWNVRLAARLHALEERVAAGTAPVRAPGEPVGGFDQPAAAAGAPSLATLFESLVGGRLLIWVGGVALVVAAIFLIRFTIEIGLITPELRMIAAAAFGLALLAGGEGMKISGWLRDDPRISQALVGAGLVVLYATVYGSYILYGFIGIRATSALMLIITAAALGLSLRHGIGTAAMGMIGGYLTPALVGDPDAGALPLLAYLALLDAAVFAIAWRRKWGWLAGVAVLASFAWTLSLMFGPAEDAVAAGWFVLVLGIAAAVARPAGAGLSWLQPLALAAAELAMLIVRADTGPFAWLLFGGIAAASLAIARWRGQKPWVALAILVIGVAAMAAEWLVSDPAWLPAAAAGLTLLFGGGGLALALERRSASWAFLACGGLSAPAGIARRLSPALMSETGWGLLLAALSAGAILLVWALRKSRGAERIEFIALAPASTAAGLLAFAAIDLAPADGLSIGWLILSILFIAAGMAWKERSVRVAGLVLLTVTVLKLFLIDAAELEGVLRILSFFGLGASLIVLGRFYGTLLRTDRGKPVATAPQAAAG
jgi:uncharacterized membrane protein